MGCPEASFRERVQRASPVQVALPWAQPTLLMSSEAAGDISQLLLGGKSLQDAPKITTTREIEPLTTAFFFFSFFAFLMKTYFIYCSLPLSIPAPEELQLNIFSKGNYYFPYLFSPALAALLEAECIFSMGSQSGGCIPGLWYMERHGTPANKGPNSLYIPMVLWMACPAQSLQRRQTARRIGVYVSFQSFTNTLLICGLSWPLWRIK